MTATRRLAVLAVLVAGLLAGLLTAPGPAAALPITAAPRILMLGDSITWQVCGGQGERFTSDAPQYLRDRDGGCYGLSGATTADMAFVAGGGRFFDGGGQPHPWFPDRGMNNVFDVREAITRADVLVIGLGTNDSNRSVGCGQATQTPWPIQVSRPAHEGGDNVPCQVSPTEFAQHLTYFVWLSGGKPIFWFDVAVTNPDDPAYPNQQAYNDAIWAAAGRYPNFHPVAWNRAVQAHPEWLRDDGVHLRSPAGNAGRYSTLIAALTGCGYR